jgi:hypothetical protein
MFNVGRRTFNVSLPVLVIACLSASCTPRPDSIAARTESIYAEQVAATESVLERKLTDREKAALYEKARSVAASETR